MIALLVLLPLLAGGIAFALRDRAPARGLLAATAAMHAALTAAAWRWRPGPIASGWLALDDAGLLILALCSALFLAAAAGWRGISHGAGQGRGGRPGSPREAAPHVQAGCLLVFLGTMTLTAVSRHLGLLWVAVEATTLATAPLIYAERTPRALEATWKYLVVCSVGIALALLGNFLLAAATPPVGGVAVPFTVDALVRQAPAMSVPWVRAAFIFLLVGYGTKMGLAPLHTWLPDAHSEAPPAVSALLSGALLNCAFLGLMRGHQVCVAAGQAAFSGGLLAGIGVFSVALAAVFLLRQPDYKRLLAYSSVEHMGLLAFGVGAGGAAVFGALLHAVNHSLTKAALFLTAGRIVSLFGSKRVEDVRGLLGVSPATGALWMAGLFAITGAPPFGTFVSEFTIFRAAFERGRVGLGALALALLVVAFAGMARAFLGMAQGSPPADGVAPAPGDTAARVLLPAALLLLAVLGLGMALPGFLRAVLVAGAAALGGGTP